METPIIKVAKPRTKNLYCFNLSRIILDSIQPVSDPMEKKVNMRDTSLISAIKIVFISNIEGPLTQSHVPNMKNPVQIRRVLPNFSQ